MKRNILVTAIVVASTLGLTACSSDNAYTGEQQPNKTTVGAGAGAATGAIVGAALTGGPGAILGAAAGGALVGGTAGYTYDQYETGVRQQLQGTGVSVIEIEGSNDIMLVMPSDIHYRTASAAISPAYKNILNSVAKVMKKYEFTVAEIPGHTDSKGSIKYNMELSALRAQGVANYLETQGIPNNRVVAVPFGESMPLFSNKTAHGRAMNRRVSIILHTPPTRAVDAIKPVDGVKK